MNNYFGWFKLDSETGKIPIPCSDQEFVDWMRDNPSARIVKQEYVVHFYVSTVFLGLDHSFGSDGPPLLFETMVFDHSSTTHRNEDLYMDRYPTWELAIAGHRKALGWAQSRL